MVHLTVHLVAEAKVAGPVRYRWMYPIEMYLRTLKSYVRNKARPEGSIARGYLAEECLTFCSRHMDDLSSKLNRKSRNDDVDDGDSNQHGLEIFRPLGRPLGKPTPCYLSHSELEQVHSYVLLNCDELEDLINKHKAELSRENPRNVDKRHKAEFSAWVHVQVEILYRNGKVNADLYNLVCRSSHTIKRYSGYIVNGFRFHTLDRQEIRKCQNSGVLVRGDDESDKEYYGILRGVYELQYPGGNIVFAFKCDWFDVQHEGRGYKKDEYGITSVHVGHSLRTNEIFVLDSQVEQIFYVAEPRNNDWLVVVKTEPRDLYKMPDIDAEDCALEELENEAVQPEVISNAQHFYSTLAEEEFSLATNKFMIEKGTDIVKWVKKEIDLIKQQHRGMGKKCRKNQTSDLEDFIVDDDIDI